MTTKIDVNKLADKGLNTISDMVSNVTNQQDLDIQNEEVRASLRAQRMSKGTNLTFLIAGGALVLAALGVLIYGYNEIRKPAVPEKGIEQTVDQKSDGNGTVNESNPVIGL